MNIQLERTGEIAAGELIEVRRFPFELGQAKECDLRIDAKGVWGRHLVLNDEGENGITAVPCSDAFIVVNNGVHRNKVRLNHGDLLGLGATKFHCWFAPLGQADRCGGEKLVWFGLLLLVLCQLGVISWLIG